MVGQKHMIRKRFLIRNDGCFEGAQQKGKFESPVASKPKQMGQHMEVTRVAVEKFKSFLRSAKLEIGPDDFFRAVAGKL